MSDGTGSASRHHHGVVHLLHALAVLVPKQLYVGPGIQVIRHVVLVEQPVGRVVT